MSEEHVPRLVKVNGVDLLELREQQVSWHCVCAGTRMASSTRFRM
jgi:hypothetical protein